MIRIYKGSIKNEVDEVAIQQEISSYLQLDNINFLIGAGCSSNIVDGVEQGIPGMKNYMMISLRTMMILVLLDLN